ncbi:hypothetical protein [Nonomuraea rubra]|uniref:hypothetical protein n=1 Tax=Nonomuraea rubra TaxID=46180 RepID=UPI0031EC369B
MVSRTTFDLLVAGDANPDVIVSGSPRHPEFGQREQLVPAAGLVLGGSGAITAYGAAGWACAPRSSGGWATTPRAPSSWTPCAAAAWTSPPASSTPVCPRP